MREPPRINAGGQSAIAIKMRDIRVVGVGRLLPNCGVFWRVEGEGERRKLVSGCGQGSPLAFERPGARGAMCCGPGTPEGRGMSTKETRGGVVMGAKSG